VTAKVSALTLERDGNKIKASFKVPSWMSDTSKDDHACWIDHELRMDREYANGTAVKPISMFVGNWDGPDITKTGADRYWIRGQERSSTVEKNYDRSWYHPVKLNIFCKKVVWGAFGGNGLVGAGWGASMQNIGPIVWAQRTIGLPRKPSVSWAYDQSNAKATVTIRTDEGADWNERYDTMYQVVIRKADGKEATLRKWTASRATEINATFDLSPYLGRNMGIGKYITIKCQAYARGMAGDNPSPANPVTVTRSVYWPSAATIGAITCSSKSNTGRVTVSVTPGKAFKTTTQLQLQRAFNADKNWNGSGGSWSDVSGATDNGDCSALYDTYRDVDPEPGIYTFYRVKSSRDQYTQYSAIKRADCLYTAKPKYSCSATVGIVSVTPISSGDAATVIMGWSDATSNYGWELSWSDNKGAWNSTTTPTKIEYDPTSGMAEHDSSSKSKSYKQTKTLRIDDLTPGTTYYVRMRRKREIDSTSHYSAYSTIFSFTTESAKDDRCGIISTSPSKNGTSCVVVVGFTEDAANTGTELSWSTSSGAWSSDSETPTTSTYTASGSDSSTKWAKQVSLTVSNLAVGTTYYVRARRYKETSGTTTYTPYSAIQKFVTESAADDQAFIVSVDPATTGETATVVVGFNEGNPNTGTEIQWSTDRYAWQSNKSPESMTATWGRTAWSGGAYAYKQTVYLRDLIPGKTYYIKARRYLEGGGNTDYSKWSPLQSFKTPRVTAANDKCAIVSVTKHSDGQGANVIVGWTEDTANDSTELTWSTDKDAWHSNQQPSSLQADWSDNVSRDENWKKTQLISLHGLERGETYFIRARRYRSDSEGETFSPYSPMSSITLPAEKTDEDVRCGLISVTGQSDGTSAVVVVGWDGDHTGCEVTWSTDPNAWESSDRPSSMTLDWQDAESKSENWSHTSTCYLRGLEEGVTHYVKARSYYEHNGTSWSDYTGDISVTPYGAPSSVALNAPEAVARGESIECYWAIASEMDQVEWHIHEEGHPNTSLADGTGTLCYGNIPADKYEGRDSISFYVSAGCGGELTDSDIVSVGIADYPMCELSCAATLTAQPVSFEVYTDNDAATVLCALYAEGVTVSAPDGDKDQLRGDAVWSQLITPTWIDSVWGDTALRTQLSDAVTAAQDAYDDEVESATFIATEDHEVLENVTYYLLSAGVYAPVEPVSVVNPASELWYEETDGEYVLTSDSSVVSGKVYYTRTGSGTEEDPYEYEPVDPVSVVDPSDEGWYVVSDTEKALAIANLATGLADAQAVLAAHPADAACTTATVVLPSELEIWDGASYTLSAKAVEPVAGLTSDAATCRFDVRWAHQAFAPAATLTVDSENRNVAITLQSGTPAGDVVVIGESVEMGDGTFKSLAVDGKSVQGGTPTPDNPVDVQVVESAQLLTFTPGTQTVNGITSTIAADGTWTLSGTATADVNIYYTPNNTIPITAGDVVTISGMPTEGYSSSNWRVALSGSGYFTTANGTLTSPSTGNRGCHVQVKSGYTMPSGWTAKPMMARGSTVKPWTPHGCIGLQVGETVTPIDLQGNVLASLPDGTRDELSIDSTGAVTLTKRIGKSIFNGSENWISITAGSRVALSIADILQNADANSKIGILCDYFVEKTMNESYSQVGVSSNNAMQQIVIRPSTENTSVEDWKTWLQTHNVTAYYKLATPQTIDLGVITLPDIAQGESVSVSAAVTPSLTLTYHADGFLSTDVCDVYRMSPAGHQLVAESIPLDGELSDPYAPFGSGPLHYRVALRTPDGDFAFQDFPYTMKVVGSRFDWDGKFVELPYNLVLSESYKKDYEARSHSDGSVNGYYGPAVAMTFSLSSDVVKVDYETLRLLREMANYPGPVFCRSQNGLAFQGNVELNELGTSYNNSSMVAPISLNVTYEDLTDQYKCQGGDMNGLEPDYDPHGHDDGGEG
jgi:hypothetical protein